MINPTPNISYSFIPGFRKEYTMKKIIGLLTILFITGLTAQELKNVQVLPFTTKKEINKYMKGVVGKSLGVKCNFCHNMKDKSSDEKTHKVIAREMMKMVNMINAQMDSISTVAVGAGMDHWKEAPVLECWVCHRGETMPETSRPQ